MLYQQKRHLQQWSHCHQSHWHHSHDVLQQAQQRAQERARVRARVRAQEQAQERARSPQQIAPVPAASGRESAPAYPTAAHRGV